MPRFSFSNIGVEIAIQEISGSLQKRFGFPAKEGYWVYFKLDSKKEVLPLVDEDLKIKIYNHYSEALMDASIILLNTTV